MTRPALTESFILRVHRQGTRERLTVHNLRTGELLSFATWGAFVRYARELPQPRRLK